MSKRKSQTAIADYRGEGFIPEAMVNFLALLGWSTGTEEEILTLDDLAGRFDLEHVQKGGAVFDRERLEWMNGQWIRRLEPDDLIERLAAVPRRRAAGRPDRPAARRRGAPPARADHPGAPAEARRDRRPRRASCGSTGRARPGAARAEALGSGDDARRRCARRARRSTDRPARSPSRPTSSSRRCARSPRIGGWKAGDLFMAIRVAVTGRTATPPLFDSLVALGHERVLSRLDAAIDTLATIGGTRLMTHDVGRASPTRPSRPGSTPTSAPGRRTTRSRSRALFSEDAEYRWHPADEPEVGREAIVVRVAQPGRQRQRSRRAGHVPRRVPPVRRRRPSRRRRSARARTGPTPRARRSQRIYYNNWLLEFDDDGRCSSFTEYWMEPRKS